MRPLLDNALLLSVLAVCAGACVPVEVTAEAGYAQVEVGGDLALNGSGGNAAALRQDVESAFGLGDRQGSPYFRAQADVGGFVFTSSALWLRESGRGQLDDTFGGLLAGTTVDSRLDLTIVKASATYDFDVGPVTLSPGVLFDVFALDFSARELTLGSREEIDDVVFVPMPFLRAEGELGAFAAIGEIGFLDVEDLGDNEGQFLDVELTIEWRAFEHGHLFAGYRYLGVDGSGDTGDDRFATDLDIRGWTIGGGVRF